MNFQKDLVVILSIWSRGHGAAFNSTSSADTEIDCIFSGRAKQQIWNVKIRSLDFLLDPYLEITIMYPCRIHFFHRTVVMQIRVQKYKYCNGWPVVQVPKEGFLHFCSMIRIMTMVVHPWDLSTFTKIISIPVCVPYHHSVISLSIHNSLENQRVQLHTSYWFITWFQWNMFRDN